MLLCRLSLCYADTQKMQALHIECKNAKTSILGDRTHAHTREHTHDVTHPSTDTLAHIDASTHAHAGRRSTWQGHVCTLHDTCTHTVTRTHTHCDRDAHAHAHAL
jgi:hypothetical protein